MSPPWAAVARIPPPSHLPPRSMLMCVRFIRTWTGYIPPIHASFRMRKLDKLSFEEMLELAAVGSKILVLRSVEYARAFNVPLRVRSSYSSDTGTLIAGSMEEIPMEEAVLTGVATDKT